LCGRNNWKYLEEAYQCLHDDDDDFFSFQILLSTKTSCSLQFIIQLDTANFFFPVNRVVKLSRLAGKIRRQFLHLHRERNESFQWLFLIRKAERIRSDKIAPYPRFAPDEYRIPAGIKFRSVRVARNGRGRGRPEPIRRWTINRKMHQLFFKRGSHTEVY